MPLIGWKGRENGKGEIRIVFRHPLQLPYPYRLARLLPQHQHVSIDSHPDFLGSLQHGWTDFQTPVDPEIQYGHVGPPFKITGSHHCRDMPDLGDSWRLAGSSPQIHVDNFGYRDVEAKKAPDQDTLYFVASLSKLFTAAGIGILVDEKKLEWNTPVSCILPEFDHPDETVKNRAGIVDFLSHRSGLAGKTQMWYLEFARPSLPRRETMRFSSYLEVVYAFQQR